MLTLITKAITSMATIVHADIRRESCYEKKVYTHEEKKSTHHDREDGFNTWGISSKSRCFSDFHPYINETTSVLDVGCGNGVATQLLAERLKPKSIRALEPGSAEGEYDQVKAYLDTFDIPVDNMTLQEAVEKPEYYHQFDVATVFKYNAPFYEKDSFARALAQTLRPDGVALITIVEHSRMCYGYLYDNALYIGNGLYTYFGDVKLKEISHNGIGYEGLIICKHPRM